MDRRWAGFKRNKAANFAAIRRIIVAAQAKGLRPVLLDLPLNVAVVGSGLDKPRAAIRAGCTDLAGKHRRPYLHFNELRRAARARTSGTSTTSSSPGTSAGSRGSPTSS